MSWYAPTADDLFSYIGIQCVDQTSANLPTRYVVSKTIISPDPELFPLCEEAIRKDVYSVNKVLISSYSMHISKNDNFEVPGQIGLICS